jgi:hypothetical protein
MSLKRPNTSIDLVAWRRKDRHLMAVLGCQHMLLRTDSRLRQWDWLTVCRNRNYYRKYFWTELGMRSALRVLIWCSLSASLCCLILERTSHTFHLSYFRQGTWEESSRFVVRFVKVKRHIRSDWGFSKLEQSCKIHLSSSCQLSRSPSNHATLHRDSLVSRDQCN